MSLTLHLVCRTGRGGLARHEYAPTGDRGPAGSATAAGAGGLTGDTTVSVEAISWALNLAPVPAGRGGQPSSACKYLLVGLANHAGPDGTGAFPSVATLVRYTGLSERTVRTCLDRLAAVGIIGPCGPGIVAARIKRADRRPQGWGLNLGLVRGDLDAAAVAVLEHQFPGLGARLAAAQPGADGRAGGVQSPHPVATGREAVDNWPGGVQRLHPNHTKNHPGNPPPPRARRLLRRLLAAVGRPVSSSPPWAVTGSCPLPSGQGSRLSLPRR